MRPGVLWWAGLIALAGLWQCIRLPWATDVLPGGWQWAAARPIADAAGSVQALALNQDLGGGWPGAAFYLAMAVRDVWVLALVASAAMAVARWFRPGLLAGQEKAWLRTVAGAALTVLPLAAAAVGAQTVRAVGVHALPGLVALPVPLVAGAALSALWLRRGEQTVPAARSVRALAAPALTAVAAVTAAGLAVGAGATGFARWYTTSRLVTSTVSDLPVPVAGPGPARPGQVAWTVLSPYLDPMVLQRAGYTVVASHDDAVRGAADGEVRVYDSATGRPRWRFREAGARLDVVDLTPDTLVLRAVDLADRPRLIGLDLASGRQLWSATPSYLWPTNRIFSPPQDSPLAYVSGTATVRGTLYQAAARLTAGDGLEERPVRAGANFTVKDQLGCRLDDVFAQQASLVTRESCSADRLTVGAGTGPGWSVTLPPGPPYAAQLGSEVVAAVVSSPGSLGSGASEWRFYRLRDGRLLWRSRDPARQISADLLAGNLVIQQTGATDLTVRDALTGRILWQASAKSLRLTAGELDSKLAASGDRVYALWNTYGRKHVSLLSFDASTGRLAGVTDLTKVTGDTCRMPTSLVSGRDSACETMTLDDAGGGVVLVTATAESGSGSGSGRFHDTIVAVAAGPGFEPAPGQARQRAGVRHDHLRVLITKARAYGIAGRAGRWHAASVSDTTLAFGGLTSSGWRRGEAQPDRGRPAAPP